MELLLRSLLCHNNSSTQRSNNNSYESDSRSSVASSNGGSIAVLIGSRTSCAGVASYSGLNRLLRNFFRNFFGYFFGNFFRNFFGNFFRNLFGYFLRCLSSATLLIGVSYRPYINFVARTQLNVVAILVAFLSINGGRVELYMDSQAVANFTRASLTVLFLKKYTSFFKSSDKRVTLKDYKSVLSLGLPDATFMLMVAFQNYFTLRVVLLAFGDDGGAIYGLCSFCLNVVNIILFGIQASMRPLMGLYTGGGDLQGIRILMRRGMLLMVIGAGLFTSIVILHPDFFYHIHGIKDIPIGGLLSVQIYSIFFIIRGFNHIFRLYFSNEKDIKFATTLTVIGSATLPLFALILYYLNVPGPYIFFSYTITELIILAPSLLRYKHLRKKNRQNESDDIVLYMTVEKDQAVDASRYIREFAKARGIDERTAYRVALCMEEMVAFIEDSGTFLNIPRNYYYVDIVIRFKDKSNAIFTTLDDGAFIDMESSTEMQELITDNYGLIKRMATSIKYEYILNLNYTIITI